MSFLQASIKDIDHKIESMYEEDVLKRLEYQLHAVMVHEGGVDSGHYWAYVKDHKKQVNTTWTEMMYPLFDLLYCIRKMPSAIIKPRRNYFIKTRVL